MKEDSQAGWGWGDLGGCAGNRVTASWNGKRWLMYGKHSEVSQVLRAHWGLGLLNNSADPTKKGPLRLGIWGLWPWVSVCCNLGVLGPDKGSSWGGGSANCCKGELIALSCSYKTGTWKILYCSNQFPVLPSLGVKYLE